MLQNGRITAFTASGILRENQQEGGKITPPPQPRFGLKKQITPSMIGGIKYFVGETAQNFVVDFENANSRLIIKPWYKNHQTRKTIRKRYLNQRYSNKITGMRYFHFNVILKSIKNRLAEHQHSNDINQKSRASI